MCKVISVANQKGGVGKTVTCVNLGIGLAREGKKVLMIDADPQGSLSISLGVQEPDKLNYTLTTVMMNVINDEPINSTDGILHHEEGVDFLPGNIELSGLEISLTGVISRETILREYIDMMRERYDYIIIDCMPSLGMLTINALACADSVLIPVQAAYLPVKGLQQLIKTISRVKRQLNPKLNFEGILLTMVDNRTNYAKDISMQVYDAYSSSVKVFDVEIPMSVRAAEISAEGSSIYVYDPKGKAAMAIFDVAQWVVQQSGGIISNSTAIDDSALATMQSTLEAMGLGPLFVVFIQSIFVQFIMNLLAVIIFAIVNGRMIEIYLTVSLAPIPFATFGNREQSMMGQNYLRSLWALAFQGFLIMVCVGIYAVLIQSIAFSTDIMGSIWRVMGYTVLLVFTLFKTGSIAKSVLHAH